MHCRRCGRKTAPDGAHYWCNKCQAHDYVNPAPAVGVAIMRGPRILLAKRAREPKRGMWDLIGGFVDPGETVPQAIHREVREETGMRISSLQPIHQAPGEYLPGQPTLNFIYLATAEGGPVAADDVDEVHWFNLDHLPKLAWRHERDALAALRRRYTLEHARPAQD